MSLTLFRPGFALLVAVAGLVSLLATGCYFDNEEDLYPEARICRDTTGTISFAAKVQPIFKANCNGGGCHNSNSQAAGIVLDTHSGAVSAISNRLLDALKHQNGASPMPKNGSRLPNCDIAKVELWINQGAENN